MSNYVYVIDFKLLEEQNLTIDEYTTLIKIHYDNSIYKEECLTSLQEKQFIKIFENEILLREKSKILIDIVKLEMKISSNNKKIIKKSERKINSELDSFIEEFRNKWKGLKPGSMGSLSNCRSKMEQWMTDNPNYTPQQILNAADIYIKSLNNYTYLQQADYFIYKKEGKDVQSRLSAFIDEKFIEDDWTSSLS